jgi:hypothetical protein
MNEAIQKKAISQSRITLTEVHNSQNSHKPVNPANPVIL